MSALRHNRYRFLLVFALTLVLATTAYGFAASNTVADSAAGDGSGVVSGYNITNITYTLDATDPTKMTAVEFDATGVSSATTVYAKVTGGSLTACSGGPTTWTCTFAAPLSVSAVTSLQVVAAQ